MLVDCDKLCVYNVTPRATNKNTTIQRNALTKPSDKYKWNSNKMFK